MKENVESVILKACVKLGLDITTGKSFMITTKALEDSSGLRLTSNGSKVIRRDSQLFGKFNILYLYGKSGAVIGYTFLGYKTKDDQLQYHSNKISDYSDKMMKMKDLIESQIRQMELITEEGGDFSFKDIEGML